MQFQVLGPVTAYGEQGPIDLGSARQRTVLAVLLVDPGALVPVDQLADRVWGAASPSHARRTVQTYLSRLRSVLSDAGCPALTKGAASYSLAVDRSAVDMHRFRALLTQARQTTDDDQAAPLGREALDLWQGTPFAGLDSEWLQAVAVGLAAERRAATLDHVDLRLRCGEHAQLLPQLTAAAGESPLDERLAGQLMLALYRCGRQSDALATYRALHERLIDQLGSDPGPVLQHLHHRILRHDPDLTRTRTVPALEPSRPDTGPPPPSDRPRQPAQLPADVAGFTGRDHDLKRLDEVLVETPDGTATSAVVITAIGGTAGVGKTALAVHWAHRVANRFPDGQLYLNLRGYDPEQPVTPADALARFLTALGVPDPDIPLDPDERAARYRSEVAGRRILVLLDNAATVAQVRPLLPGSGTCLVVVTSRDDLAGLVALHGAHRLDLDLLPLDDAIRLLHRLIGARVSTEPDAAVRLARQCARLPLALRVAAELAASRPDDPLAELIAELADRQTRLELLSAGGDPYAAVQAVFSWSLQQLPPAAVRTFRLLGLHPGPDLDPYAVAALAGTEVAPARQALVELARAHLVHRIGGGRYGMHDLLRAYASHLATSEEAGQPRRAAQERLLDYYCRAATAAVEQLFPAEPLYRSAAPDAATAQSATPVPDLATPDAARAWLDAERPNLIAIAAHAAAQDRAGHVTGLARVLHRYLCGGHLTDAVTVDGLALRAAERAGDLIGQAHQHRQLGFAYLKLGQRQLAAGHYQQALAHFRRAGDGSGEALARNGLGNLADGRGDHRLAIDEFRQAVTLATEAGNRMAAAIGLANLGSAETTVGLHTQAIDHQEQAIAIFQELGSHTYEAIVRNNLANSLLALGQHESAGRHLREILPIFQRLGNVSSEAQVLHNLGLLHLRQQEPAEATDLFRLALARIRQAGERASEVATLNALGDAAQLAGDPAATLAYHTEALTLAAEVDDQHEQARAHLGIGHAHRNQGDLAQARAHYAQAYAGFTELDLPAAEDVRAYLSLVADPAEVALTRAEA